MHTPVDDEKHQSRARDQSTNAVVHLMPSLHSQQQPVDESGVLADDADEVDVDNEKLYRQVVHVLHALDESLYCYFR